MAIDLIFVVYTSIVAVVVLTNNTALEASTAASSTKLN